MCTCRCQLLYDLDIVEEKTILEWAAKPSRKYASRELVADVLRRAQPFLEWLQQAEEDSDDDEEDIEVRFKRAGNSFRFIFIFLS